MDWCYVKLELMILLIANGLVYANGKDYVTSDSLIDGNIIY